MKKNPRKYGSVIPNEVVELIVWLKYRGTSNSDFIRPSILTSEYVARLLFWSSLGMFTRVRHSLIEFPLTYVKLTSFLNSFLRYWIFWAPEIWLFHSNLDNNSITIILSDMEFVVESPVSQQFSSITVFRNIKWQNFQKIQNALFWALFVQM